MATRNNSGFYAYIDENNHHDAWRIIVLCFVLAVIVGASLFLWRPDTQTEPASTQSDIEARMALLEAQNPSANISQEEVKHRQQLLSSPNPKATVSIDEIERRMRLLGEI